MKLFKNWFCSHQWLSHNKKDMTRVIRQNAYGSYLETPVKQDFTIEILICQKCGKIKQLQY